MSRPSAGLVAAIAMLAVTFVTQWLIMAAITEMGRPAFVHYIVALVISVPLGVTVARKLFGRLGPGGAAGFQIGEIERTDN